MHFHLQWWRRLAADPRNGKAHQGVATGLYPRHGRGTVGCGYKLYPSNDKQHGASVLVTCIRAPVRSDLCSLLSSSPGRWAGAVRSGAVSSRWVQFPKVPPDPVLSQHLCFQVLCSWSGEGRSCSMALLLAAAAGLGSRSSAQELSAHWRCGLSFSLQAAPQTTGSRAGGGVTGAASPSWSGQGGLTPARPLCVPLPLFPYPRWPGSQPPARPSTWRACGVPALLVREPRPHGCCGEELWLTRPELHFTRAWPSCLPPALSPSFVLHGAPSWWRSCGQGCGFRSWFLLT